MRKAQSSTLPPLHEVERPPSTLQRLVICDSCHAAIAGGDLPETPPTAYGLCDRCDELRARANISRFARARAAADQYLDDHLDGSDHTQTRAQFIDGLVVAVWSAYEEEVRV